jgi:hypothetical protein
VTISGLVAQNKVYTSTTEASVTGTLTATGLLGSDTSSVIGAATVTFASPNVANDIAVVANLSTLSLSNRNYVVVGLTAPLTANITPAALRISSALVAQNKVYDTTTSATIAALGTPTLSGIQGSDAANLVMSSSGPYLGSFAQGNVGNSLVVTPATTTSIVNGINYTTMAGVSLSGSAAANYYIAGLNTNLTAAITPAPVTISGLVAASKQFDGSTAAVIGGAPTISGLIGSDASTLTGGVVSGAFASASAGTRIGVTANLSSLTLGNGNYYITDVSLPLLADITVLPQTISNIVAVVQQISREPAPTVTYQALNVPANKGDILYVRDSENMGGFYEAISVPPLGTVSFPLPNQILQNLIDMTASNNETNAQAYKYLLLTDGATISVSAEDGNELPKGVTYSPASRAFTVANLAEVTLPISVRVTVTRQGNVVSTKKLVVSR